MSITSENSLPYYLNVHVLSVVILTASPIPMAHPAIKRISIIEERGFDFLLLKKEFSMNRWIICLPIVIIFFKIIISVFGG